MVFVYILKSTGSTHFFSQNILELGKKKLKIIYVKRRVILPMSNTTYLLACVYNVGVIE